jgi:hypothetical protein
VQEGIVKKQTTSQVHIEMLKDHQGISIGTAEVLVVSEKVGQLVKVRDLKYKGGGRGYQLHRK